MGQHGILGRVCAREVTIWPEPLECGVVSPISEVRRRGDQAGVVEKPGFEKFVVPGVGVHEEAGLDRVGFEEFVLQMGDHGTGGFP